MDFNDLMGKPCDFHGVDNNRFRLDFEGKLYTFEAVENEDDGHRSMMDEVRSVSDDEPGIFFDTPVARVIPTEVEDLKDDDMLNNFDGYELRDETTGHVWLRLGTNETGDDYPCFKFDYSPSGEQHPAADTTG